MIVFERGLTYALVHEGVELALIFDLDELLAAIGRVADVQLRKDNVSQAATTQENTQR
jgi:hypothetical protein